MGRKKPFQSRRKRYAQQPQPQEEKRPSVVGPGYMEILDGHLFGAEVSIIMCGESHHDAIDVTREKGIFHPKTGWVEVDDIGLPGQVFNRDKSDGSENKESLAIKIITKSKTMKTLKNSMEWSADFVKEKEIYGNLFLFWSYDNDTSATPKGRPFIVEVEYEASLDDPDFQEGWAKLPKSDISNSGNARASSTFLQTTTKQAIRQVDPKADISAGKYTLHKYDDLDAVARELNSRRLSDHHVPTSTYDDIINTRKLKRQEEGIWTWDDWFDHLQSTLQKKEIPVDLILEGSIPPWELDLHRPIVEGSDVEGGGMKFDLEALTLPEAAECIRRLPEDDAASAEDQWDPSSDGIGSYIDFIYRKFMNKVQNAKANGHTASSSAPAATGTGEADETRPRDDWLHCVDMRDLGCEAACRTPVVAKLWEDKLHANEREVVASMSKKQGGAKPAIETPTIYDGQAQFLPQSMLNAEAYRARQLEAEGELAKLGTNDDDDDDDDADIDDEHLAISYPSFEGFFGQNTDFLYYDKQVFLAYSPFLAHCIGSKPTWEAFIQSLFFGGTIPEAMAHVNLKDHRGMIHVRSPIHEKWDENPMTYSYYERDDREHYISFPYFPYLFFLAAKNTMDAPTTWSSNEFRRLHQSTTDAPAAAASTASQGHQTASSNPAQFALAVREWAIASAIRHGEDPKNSDDTKCGGEWFEAYLHAAHRGIYVDIERDDPTQLLVKNQVPSLFFRKKHNIGEIQIPSADQGYEDIVAHFAKDMEDGKVIPPEIEVMAKIIIDIWMSNLVDFGALLRLGNIVKERKVKASKIVVVMYMGSSHTQNLTAFLTNIMGFKKSSFVGDITGELGGGNVSQSLDLAERYWKM